MSIVESQTSQQYRACSNASQFGGFEWEHDLKQMLNLAVLTTRVNIAALEKLTVKVILTDSRKSYGKNLLKVRTTITKEWCKVESISYC